MPLVVKLVFPRLLPGVPITFLIPLHPRCVLYHLNSASLLSSAFLFKAVCYLILELEVCICSCGLPRPSLVKCRSTVRVHVDFKRLSLSKCTHVLYIQSEQLRISAWNEVSYLPNLLLTQAFGFALYISVPVPVVRILLQNRFTETVIKHCTGRWGAL